MKKILLVLAVLLIASPTWAGLDITAEQVGDTNTVRITYDMEDTDPNLPRAFALEISLSQENGANIGPVTYVHPEFHVYPGSIVITGGVVTNQGTPVADSDANSIIVEMGSLYAATDPCHTSPPAENGTLLEFQVANDQDCNVILVENAIRGGVVMEDTTQVFSSGYVTLTGCRVEFNPACKGDVTGDTQVSIGDLSAIVAALSPAYAGSTPPYTACPPPAGLEQGDVTGDGCLSIADLSAIVAYLSPAYAGSTPPYTGPCMP